MCIRDRAEFAPHAKTIHIDIDPAEIGKIREVDVPIVGDLKGVLASMIAQLEKDGAEARDDEWLQLVAGWRKRYPLSLIHIWIMSKAWV